jgi:hypothetical protein
MAEGYPLVRELPGHRLLQEPFHVSTEDESVLQEDPWQSVKELQKTVDRNKRYLRKTKEALIRGQHAKMPLQKQQALLRKHEKAFALFLEGPAARTIALARRKADLSDRKRAHEEALGFPVSQELSGTSAFKWRDFSVEPNANGRKLDQTHLTRLLEDFWKAKGRRKAKICGINMIFADGGESTGGISWGDGIVGISEDPNNDDLDCRGAQINFAKGVLAYGKLVRGDFFWIYMILVADSWSRFDEDLPHEPPKTLSAPGRTVSQYPAFLLTRRGDLDKTKFEKYVKRNEQAILAIPGRGGYFIEYFPLGDKEVGGTVLNQAPSILQKRNLLDNDFRQLKNQPNYLGSTKEADKHTAWVRSAERKVSILECSTRNKKLHDLVVDALSLGEGQWEKTPRKVCKENFEFSVSLFGMKRRLLIGRPEHPWEVWEEKKRCLATEAEAGLALIPDVRQGKEGKVLLWVAQVLLRKNSWRRKKKLAA